MFFKTCINAYIRTTDYIIELKRKKKRIKKITKRKQTKTHITKTITPNHLKKKEKKNIQNMQHTKYQKHNHLHTQPFT